MNPVEPKNSWTALTDALDGINPIQAVPAPLVVKSIPAHLGNYSRVTRIPTTIVIHATHGAEGLTKDTDSALEISKPLPKGKERSFHYAVDANSATQSVRDEYTAWHARRHGNSIGIGIELCGMADQSREQWLDPISLGTLRIAARLCADICARWSIPPTLVDAAGLLEGHPGITTHDFVSKAWKESDHWDPGPHFPLAEFIAAVGKALKK
jgi:N-acetyl-anhydromuramyl-L-alanine amidase AmpD